jgi:hypothetical protein
MKKTNPVDCFNCLHFYITWDAVNPRGCRAFGFKTARIPSDVVFETSGEVCLKFKAKNKQATTKKKKDGWQA